MYLSNLPINKLARITNISGENVFIERLSDLGVFVGSKVKVLRIAPLLDPLEIKIKSFRIAIRKKDARYIEVIPYD